MLTIDLLKSEHDLLFLKFLKMTYKSEHQFTDLNNMKITFFREIAVCLTGLLGCQALC